MLLMAPLELICHEPMQLAINFNSSPELAEILKDLGYELNITQLSNGFQQGSYLSNSSREGIISTQLSSSQDLSIEGSRNPDFIPFITTSGPMLDHGKMMGKQSLFHFGRQLKETSTIHYAGSIMSVLLIPYTSIKDNTSDNIIETINTKNEIFLEKTELSKFHNRTIRNLNSIDTCLEEWLIFLEELIENSIDDNSNQKEELEWEAAVKISKLIYNDLPFKPIRIKDLCKLLFTSKNKVYATCKSIFSLTPMQAIKCMRLEQTRRLLRSASLREEMNLNSILSIHTFYGFSNKRTFREQYLTLFGETPRETLSRNIHIF